MLIKKLKIPTQMHLVQFNITKLKADLENPIMKEFRDFLAPVNELAESSPGFVWRLKDDTGDAAIDIDTPFDDPMIFVNMSVWEDFETLRNYTYNTVHSYFLKNRAKWSDKMDGHQVVLWWKPEGQYPSLAEAKLKLELLQNNGPSTEAFDLKHIMEPGVQ